MKKQASYSDIRNEIANTRILIHDIDAIVASYVTFAPITRTIRTIHSDVNVGPIAVLPNGQSIVAGLWNGCVAVWDVHSGIQTHTLQNCYTTLPKAPVTCLDVFPDSTRIVSRSQYTNLHVWDLSHGKPIATFGMHTNPVTTVRVFPDGKLVVSASTDNCVRIWDPVTTECVHYMFDSPMSSIAISPNNLICGAAKNWMITLKLNVIGGTTYMVKPNLTSPVHLACIQNSSTDEISVLHFDQAGLTIRNDDLCEISNGCNTAMSGICAAVFPDGRRCVVGTYDGRLILATLHSGSDEQPHAQSQINQTVNIDNTWISNVAVFPCGKRIVVSTIDKRLQIMQ